MQQAGSANEPGEQSRNINSNRSKCQKGSNSIPLKELAYARSGDKGDTSNIGETMSTVDYCNYKLFL